MCVKQCTEVTVAEALAIAHVLYKLLAGARKDKLRYMQLLRMLVLVTQLALRTHDPNAKAYMAIGNSITSARSLMRMGRFIADVPKLQSTLTTIQNKGVTNTELKKFIEFFRTIGNSLSTASSNLVPLLTSKL